MSDFPRRSHALATLLAGIALLASARGLAQSKAAAPKLPSAIESLRAEIVPDAGPARPPYLPARYDEGLPAAKDGNRSLTDMTRQAVGRQQQLQENWNRLQNNFAAEGTPEQRADARLLAYAFGEAELDEALSAARAAGPAAQFRLARLLLAECRFDDALRLLAAVSDSTSAGDLSRKALVLLARHDVQRAALQKSVPLAPLGFDLPGYLTRRGRDPVARSLIDAVRRTTPVRLPAELAPGHTESFEIVESSETLSLLDVPVRLEPVGFSLGLSEPPGNRWRHAKLFGLDRLYLNAEGPELVLYQAAPSQPSGDPIALALGSAFNGPIRFRLYRFPTRAAWRDIGASDLGRLRPERTWTRTFRPLDQNNHGLKQWRVPVESLRGGYYLLTAEARYAPMLAACKFSVNHVCVYLRAGRNQAVVVAVDRRNGRPAADLPLRLHVAGKPDDRLICDRVKPAVQEAFLRGFRGEKTEWRYEPGTEAEEPKSEPAGPSDPNDPFADPKPGHRTSPPDAAAAESGPRREPDPSRRDECAELAAAEYLRAVESYTQGVEARRRWPDFSQDRPMRTGSDGIAAVPVDLGRREYCYTLEVQRADEALDAGPLTHASVDYQEPAAGEKRRRAIVWLAKSVCRPGELVEFAGLLRRTDGLRLLDHAKQPAGKSASNERVLVAVANRYGTVWEGPCELSAAGTFHGRFHIPPTTRMGPCRFRVDSNWAEPYLPLVVEEFRTTACRVGLSVPHYSYAGGQRIEGRVDAVYFTGKPAEGAEVDVVLEITGRKPLSTAATIGPDGGCRFSIPAPSLSEDTTASLLATVTDASGQSYTRWASVTCRADAFQVHLDASECNVAPGTTVQIEVEATDWTGAAVVGATVAAQGVRQTALTDSRGKAVLAWTVKDKDTEQVKVTVIAGRQAVHQSCRVGLSESDPDDLDPRTDASPGPARFEIGSWSVPTRCDAGKPLECTLRLKGPKDRRATVAVFVESDRLLASHAYDLRPGEHRLTIPTAEPWAPSVTLAAVVVDDQRHDPTTAECYLHPADKLLRLEIRTDRADYRPGQRCTAIVTATDYRGRPAPGARISLGVVDEALYQVREDPLPDLFQLLYECRVSDPCVGRFEAPAPVADSLHFLLGPRYAWGYYRLREPSRRCLFSAYGGCASGRRSSPAVYVRSRFDTAARWVADLATDAAGTARTTFTFPDNVTAWRFTARGVTADSRVGDVRVTRRTLLPLALDIALPRSIRVGDSVQLPVVVHNHGERARKVRGTMRAGAAAAQPWQAELAAGGQQCLTIPVTAAGVEPIEILAAVRDIDGNDPDSVRKLLAPLPRTQPTTQTWSGSLETEATVRIGLEAERGSQLAVVICREPGLAGPIRSALDALVQYPYGCVEQTMSRFMPAVVAGEAIKRVGLRDGAAERIADVVAEGLARLEALQHNDGEWGWWKDDDTNSFMTAYVLEGLAHCRRLGQRVDEEMFSRAHRGLLDDLKAARLRGRRPESVDDANPEIYAAHALAQAFAQDPQQHQQSLAELRPLVARIETAQRSLLDRVLLADTRRLLGDRPAAAAELEQLVGRAVPIKGNRGSVFVTAAVLELGAAVAPRDARWPLLARQLVAARTGDGWGDTLTTSAAVRGLAAAVVARDAATAPIAVRVDGRPAGVLTSAQGNRIALTLPRIGAVTLHRTGPPCEDFYQVRVEGSVVGPTAAPDHPAATIRTRLFSTQPPQEELIPDAGGRLRLLCGKTYKMQVTIDLKQPVTYARLTLPRPCGMELVRVPRRTDGVSAIEARDDAIHFFIERWEAGRHRIELSIRVELAGEVAAPPPELSPMYGDALPTALTGSMRWNIRKQAAQ